MSHLYRRPKKDGIYWYAGYRNGKLVRESLKTKDPATAKYIQSKKDQETSEGKYLTYDSNPPCDKVIEEYKKATEHHKLSKTIKNDISRIKDFVRWSGANTINRLTEKKLQDYLTHRINDNKLTLSSANRYIASIKAWLNFAVNRKYIFENPIDNFKKYRLPENPPRFLAKDEVQKVVDNAIKTALYAPIMTALYTGMRRKEIFTLEWQDIDFNRNIITIRNKDGFITKSKKFRTIPLHAKLKELLQPASNSSGRCFNTTNHRKIFKRINTAAKIRKIGFHDFRHTFASYLVMEGVDLYTISQILGHSSIKVTQIYSHLTKDHMQTSIEKLLF